MKKQTVKLALAKETVRKLDGSILEQALGGMDESNAYTCYTSTC
jgi:hypothetical protein